MSKPQFPITSAVRVLKEKNIDFISYLYEYEEKGGTKQTADELNVDEHKVVKTLVFEIDAKECIIMLQHGDKNVSTKELARLIEVKKVEPASQNEALKWTGYQFGGTSPFGTKKNMKVFVEESIMELDKIYINGGKRGYIVEIDPKSLIDVFEINCVKTAI